MKVDIVMPKMGESINEGTLIKWHKKKGEKVKKDEIIYEISTDKVDTEIPSPEDGILWDIKVFEQETVEVGTVVAIVETDSSQSSQLNQKAVTPSEVEVPSTKQVGGELIDVPMPKMGESIMEGTILKWHKQVGDIVKRDEIIFEISTDKVDTEVPSPVDGKLAEILFGENSTVAVGVAVAKISTSGGIVKPKQLVQEYDQDPVKDTPGKHDHENRAKQIVPSSTINYQLSTHRDQTNNFFSPLVLNIARTESISMSELETIVGTGTGGRITKNDLMKYVQSRKSSKNLPERLHGKKEQIVSSPKTENVIPKSAQRVEIIPMDNIRQRIMHHMVNSRETSVHVTAIIEVDMSRIHNFIEKNREEYAANEGIKLTYMPFISFSVIRGLKEFPLMNASIEGNNILMKKYINLGIAVAVEPNGLIVPNIKNADEKNVRGLAKSIADIGSRSRTKKLVADDITDGTFTITNYGVFGSLFGTPIINQPEVGILGVGAVTKKPVVVENDGVESIAIKPMMYLSLSHDHRLVDGMLGGKFLKSIKETLENFDTSIV
ncbi:2-oxoglutarate dehydrogenase, E2 component, dihydrolipoamide succinyltransferase [bacterium]|nr:2-oxoglutarate dehydrogenase, E2 component, dihydrolipoamide succinyltransferase [bacterium]